MHIYLQRWRLMATNILEWLKSTLTGPAQMAIVIIFLLSLSTFAVRDGEYST
jgi:hypothetical protein